MSEYKTNIAQTVQNYQKADQVKPLELSDMVTEITPTAYSWVFRLVKSGRTENGIAYHAKAADTMARRTLLLEDEWMDRLTDPAKEGTDLRKSLYG